MITRYESWETRGFPAVSGQPTLGIIHVSRVSLPSSFVDRTSSTTKTHVYVYLFFASEHFAFVSPTLPPTARAFFRGFFRGRIDTNCKTLSATVLPTDLSVGNDRRDGGGFSSPPLSSSSFVLVHSWKLGTFVASLPRNVCLFVRSPSPSFSGSLNRFCRNFLAGGGFEGFFFGRG